MEKSIRAFMPNVRKYKRGNSGGLENQTVNIGRNSPCPYGKTVDKLFYTDLGDKVIPTRLKYKDCCLGKVIFVKNK